MTVADAPRREHYVVFGCGRVGHEVVQELTRLGYCVRVVDTDPEAFRILGDDQEAPLQTIVGDAFDPDVAAHLDLPGAVGVASTLNEERDNLFLCLTARRQNPTARIVTRVDDPDAASKFVTVGVDAVVSPSLMGGVRLARELLLPGLAGFADVLLASGERMVLLLAVTVTPDSEVAGQTLAEADLIARTGCIVMGVRHAAKGTYDYHPAPQMGLRPGGSVVALGEARQLVALQRLLEGEAATDATLDPDRPRKRRKPPTLWLKRMLKR